MTEDERNPRKQRTRILETITYTQINEDIKNKYTKIEELTSKSVRGCRKLKEWVGGSSFSEYKDKSTIVIIITITITSRAVPALSH